MARIVILGAGLGGVPMAYEMREHARDEDTVTVINENAHFEFVPSNPWVGIGTRKKNEVRIDLDQPFSRKGLELVVGRARQVVPGENRVELEDGRSVDYDHLIIATGARLAFDEVPGLGPDGGHTHSVCKADHAEKTWAAYQRLIENPGPVIVGAAQGASCFGPAYEFAFLLDHDLRKRGIRDKAQITFVTAEPYIGHMGLAGVGDSTKRLKRLLGERDIDYICNAEVDRVEEGAMTLKVHGNGEGTVELQTLPFNFAMMIPAFTGIDAVRNVEGLVNPRGFVLIDEYQRNPTFPNIWSVGVAVAIPPGGKDPGPHRGAQDRLHDRRHGHRNGTERPAGARRQGTVDEGHRRRHLSGRHGQQRPGHGRHSGAGTAPRRLVQRRHVGASCEARLRKILHAQGARRRQRARLRALCPEGSRHYQDRGNKGVTSRAQPANTRKDKNQGLSAGGPFIDNVAWPKRPTDM